MTLAPVTVRHPARFTSAILDAIGGHLWGETVRVGHLLRVLDPFAGTGRVHELRHETIGVELEPEWAQMHPRTIVGDATALPFAAESFDAIATSPCYGNRFADHHEARDGSLRRSYRHDLGRPLTPGNAGELHWGPAYRELHLRAWIEARRVLRPGGLLLVNVSNHVRKGTLQLVAEWHLAAILELGFHIVRVDPIPTPRMRCGANAGARVEHEHLLVLRSPQ